MRKPISSRLHGVLDYLTVGAMLAFPRLFNNSEPFKTCLTGTALTKLLWVIFTRHELGIFKVIPMKAHLALDGIGGAAVAALPFALEEDDDAAIGFCLGMFMTDLIVGVLTDTTPSFDRRRKPQQRQFRQRDRSDISGLEATQPRQPATQAR